MIGNLTNIRMTARLRARMAFISRRVPRIGVVMAATGDSPARGGVT